jgi:hypothetical protein
MSKNLENSNNAVEFMECWKDVKLFQTIWTKCHMHDQLSKGGERKGWGECKVDYQEFGNNLL